MTRAVVVCPEGPNYRRRLQELGTYCARRSYEVVAAVRGVGQWDDALRAAVEQSADVIVLPSRKVLKSKRSPRMESITEETPKTN